MNFKKKENLVLLSQFIEVLLIQAQMGVILWIKQFNSSGFIAVILRVGDALHPGFDDIGPNGGRSKQAIFIPSLGLVGEPEASGLSEHGVIFHFFKCLLPAQTLGGIPVIIIPFVPVDMVSREMLRCLPQIPHLFQLIVMEILEVLLVFLHYSCLREPIEWETNQKKKKKLLIVCVFRVKSILRFIFGDDDPLTKLIVVRVHRPVVIPVFLLAGLISLMALQVLFFCFLCLVNWVIPRIEQLLGGVVKLGFHSKVEVRVLNRGRELIIAFSSGFA